MSDIPQQIMGGLAPGYNPEVFDKRSPVLMDLDAIASLGAFINMTQGLMNGEAIAPTAHQSDASSAGQTVFRNHLLHRLSKLFDFDVDRALKSTEQQAVVTISPLDKQRLGLADPTRPIRTPAIYRNISFGDIRSRKSFTISETEILTNVGSRGGTTQRMMRILRCIPFSEESQP